MGSGYNDEIGSGFGKEGGKRIRRRVGVAGSKRVKWNVTGK